MTWKCGKCDKEYTTDKFIALKSVPMVETDTDPREQHGYTSVCDCGYVFHRDKWMLKDTLELDTEIGKIQVEISTVFLELEHYDNTWYETMIFKKGGDIYFECHYLIRYKTKEEAVEGHKKILNLLKNNSFRLVPSQYDLDIIDE